MSLRSIPLLVLPLLGALAGRALAQDLPDGFIAERVGSTFDEPVALAFLDEQRLLVAERAGRVWYVDHDVKRNLVIDLTDEAQSHGGDRGLLGMAVAPDFDLSGWLYLLFVVRIHNAPAWSPAYSRLIRVQTELDAGGDLFARPETREVLLGDTWPTGIPACTADHTLGSLRFLSDGSLVLSCGDNAHPTIDTGGEDPDCFLAERTSADQDLGTFRAQYENSLDGKVLRLDPETGLGLSDNPFYTGNPDDARSRLYARGLRNPFRFTLLPDSGPRDALLVADVGFDTWEEINLCLGGENFGWPCFEGPYPQPLFLAADARGICSGVGQTAPLLAWNHSQEGAAGFTGNCASALCVYRGDRYPPEYRGRLFFCDFERSWMRTAKLDAELRIESTLLFGRRLEGPVELVAQPGTGDLVYVSLGAQTGAVRHLRYVGNQHPPVAVASATPDSGPGALDVTLSAAGSSDPDGQPLDYAWDLGDDTAASGPVVAHHYPVGAAYTARLTVTDAERLSDSAEVRITPGNTPPRILELASPQDGGTYVAGEPLRLAATAADVEDGAPVRATWTLDLVHGHHVHPSWASAEGLVTVIVPEVESGPGDFHFIVHLSVTDASGLTDERSAEIYDPHSQPQAHLVELALDDVRVGQRLAPIGHVDYSYGHVALKQPTLTWDWGDGTADVFSGAENHVDTRPTHVYGRPGTYKLRLVAELAGSADVQTATIHVARLQPSVAIFAPFDQERWIPRAQQEEIVAALQSALASRASEVRAFHLGEGQELARWMESLLADPLPDVVVLLDLLPSALVEGGIPGSLLERWVAHGNGLVWSGQTPFQGLLDDDGTSSQTFLGADAFFRATAPYIVLGAGLQLPTPLGTNLVPSLTSYSSERALRTDQLGTPWRVARLFAADADHDSDALELACGSTRGFYAQFCCADAPSLPRAAVLAEYLSDKLGQTKLGQTKLGATGAVPARR